MPAEMAQIEEIFAEAVSKTDAAARAAYLDQACGNDVELRQRVDQLLAAHDSLGNRFDLPTANCMTSPYVPVSEGPKSRIGRYKLLEQIGEGGFGIVFMAEQEEPVRRLVALKIIKLGMDTRQVVARFEAERQALAMMDHPNVAKVLDGGVTESGRPYFVMELVRGIPITEFCDKNNLTISKRLELFAQVCQAVQHAHQKGLIHRDIKPTNVLVSTNDDRPVAKVIDFGVAKAMQARLTEKTLFTGFQQLVGTPAYMSPEQADGSLDIDTRSDVYSIGVLLYELLTGSPPIDPKELRSKAFAELQRIIREVEPPTPSTRLNSRSDALPSVAALRSTEPRKLAATVRGELDWIVMKCLEKDRNRRYASASALAADVERYLNDETIEARPATQLYRLKKFVRRNRVVVLAGSTIFITLALGAILSSIGFVQARRHAEIAKANADESAAMTERATHVQQFLREMLTSVNPEAQVGAAMTVQQMLDQAAEKIDGSLEKEPEVRAVIHETIGETYYGLQLYAQAMKHFQAAVDLRRRYAPEDKLPLAMALMNLAKVKLVTATSLADARAYAHESAAIFSSHLPENDWRRGFARALEASLNSDESGRETEQTWAAAMLMLLPLLTDDFVSRMPPPFRDSMIEAKRLQRSGEVAAAISVLRRFYLTWRERMQKLAAAGDRSGLEKLLRELTMPALDVPWARQYMPLKGIARAQQYKSQGENPLIIEALLNSSIEVGHEVWGKEHPHIALALHERAALLRDEGRLEESETAARQAFEMRQKVLGNENPETTKSRDLLIEVLKKQNKNEEAEKLRREAHKLSVGQS